MCYCECSLRSLVCILPKYIVEYEITITLLLKTLLYNIKLLMFCEYSLK